MKKYGVITLIAETATMDDLGIASTAETTREVKCTVESASRAEVNMSREGLNPSKMFRVFTADYNEEEVCEYAGQRYSIYRTYEDGDYIELYTEKRKGTS